MNFKFLSAGFMLLLGSSGWILYIVTSMFPDLDFGPISLTSVLAFIGGILFSLGFRNRKKTEIIEVKQE